MAEQKRTGRKQGADTKKTGLPIHLDPSPGKDHQFKPGQSGNPNGRPKGRKSLSTMIQQMLNDETFIEKLNGEIKEKVKQADPEFQGTALKAMITTAMIEAIDPARKASERDAARNFLAKYGYGNKIELTGPDGESLMPIALDAAVLARMQQNGAAPRGPATDSGE